MGATLHYDVHDTTHLPAILQKEIVKDMAAYEENLEKFHSRVAAEDRASPIYKFLCFVLSERFQNTSILSHNGGRFDEIFVMQIVKAFLGLSISSKQTCEYVCTNFFSTFSREAKNW